MKRAPRKLKPETIQLVSEVAAYAPKHKVLAALLSVSEATLGSWIRNGREEYQRWLDAGKPQTGKNVLQEEGRFYRAMIEPQVKKVHEAWMCYVDSVAKDPDRAKAFLDDLPYRELRESDDEQGLTVNPWHLAPFAREHTGMSQAEAFAFVQAFIRYAQQLDQEGP